MKKLSLLLVIFLILALTTMSISKDVQAIEDKKSDIETYTIE